MSILSALLATLPEGVEAAEARVKKTKARNKSGHKDILPDDLVARLRAATGPSFTTRHLRGLVRDDSEASLVCRRLLARKLVKVERHSVNGEGKKRLHKYTWLEVDDV